MQDAQKNFLPTTQQDEATSGELSDAELSLISGGLNFTKIEFNYSDVSGDPSQWLLTRKVNEYEGQH